MKPVRKTKICPFCSEEILANAVKCRYCKEFLNESGTDLPVSHHAVQNIRKSEAIEVSAGTQAKTEPVQLKYSRKSANGPEVEPLSIAPSMRGLLPQALAAVLLLLAAGALMILPFDRWLIKLFTLSDDAAGKVNLPVLILHIIGFVAGLVAVMRFVYQVLHIKSIRYEVSADRIEWSRGIFSRKIDNIDMFRVADLKLHRSLMDCILGIGAVTLITKDQTDPVFKFEKVRNPRALYDLIKNASLAADRKQGVVHIE